MKIGEFSQLTGVPIKTLRYYDDIGLLIPASVEFNRYRKYGLQQLIELKRISELKELGLTLNEIANEKLKDMTQKELLRLYEHKLALAEKERQFVDIKIANLKKRISELKEKESVGMVLQNLNQGPNHSTLMGVIKGVADYYELGISEEMLYGLTGHAFMINIHEELCSSGPYVYDLRAFMKLLSNLGILMEDCGFFMDASTAEERNQMEEQVRNQIDSNEPCALLNLEFQLIKGYDGKGLVIAQPWSSDTAPDYLTYGTWDELKGNIFMTIFTFGQVQKKPMDKVVKAALEFAIAINRDASMVTKEPYYTGLEAYDMYIKALDNGHGNGQGNHWNATVWGECRMMASAFFQKLGELYPHLLDACQTLSHDYRLIGEGLNKIAESSLPILPRIQVLEEIKVIEGNAFKKMEGLISQL